MAFSFGGTPAASASSASSTTSSGGGGGGLFSSSSPTAAPSLTTATTPAAMPSIGGDTSSSSSSSNSNKSFMDDAKVIANIPSFQILFPNYSIRKRVEICLARWRNQTTTERVGMMKDDDDEDDISPTTTSSFAAMELIRLLNVYNRINSSGGGGGGEEEEEEEAVGRNLANPTPSIINFFRNDASGIAKGMTTTGDKTMQEKLHRALLAGAAEAAADATNGMGGDFTRRTGAIGGGGSSSSSAGEMPSSSAFFYVTLETPPKDTNANTTREKLSSTNVKVIITPRISREIVYLATELHLSDVEALALYAEAKAKLSRRNTRRFRRHHHGPSSNDYVMDMDDIDDDGDDDDCLHYVDMLVRMGQAGFVDFDEHYDDDHKESKPYSSSSSSATVAATTSSIDTDWAVRNIARHLYFRELSSTLAILHNLIQHRVEAATEILEDNHCRRRMASYSNAILVGTDQLLEAGLVTNLIQTVRELTDKVEYIGKTLNKKEEERAMSATQNISTTPSSTLFNGGYALSSSSHSGGMSSREKMAGISDMEFAFRGFAHLQRRLASECLFLLSYHSQLNVEEVAALIDLIRDLTNGNDVGESSSSLGGSLPLLDPFDDVPSPFEVGASSPPFGVEGLTWQQQAASYGNNVSRGGGGSDAMFNQWQPHFVAATPPKLKDTREWEDELVALVWKRGQPQLLCCVSTLILTVVCALDATHVLVDRASHGPNAFGIGNSLFPPSEYDRDATNATRKLLPIHERLDPESNSPAEESWTRRDIWGLLLVPYGLLLRNTTAATGRTLSPRANTSRGGIDVKGTFSQCLIVASQLKSLTFARLTLLPSVASSLVGHGSGDHSSASIYDFYLSTLSEFTAQYIDALGTTGNLPITRQEWLDEEMNMAQTEWLEKEQRRQFGEWAGEPVPKNDDDDAAEGPRAVNLLDRPDCLEDVFALASSVCEAYPSGARAFWCIVDNEQVGGSDEPSFATVLSPSRALQTLDLLQSENDSSLYVYLSFLSSLALADASKHGSLGGADMVHSYLTGKQTINPHSAGTDRHIHVMWNTIISSIRWYAEHLTPNDDTAIASTEDGTTKSSTMLRGSHAAIDETSTSYYYGLGEGNSPKNSSDSFSSSPINSERGNQSAASLNAVEGGSKVKELDEVGRNTLMALLCLISNVASKCAAAREFILGIRLPATENNNSGTYQDGSLEILFSLLITTSLPPDIMGMAFVAIANLLQPKGDDFDGATPAETMELNEGGSTLAISGNSSSIVRNDVSSAMRAWELLEMCQFIPVKLLSQYSSFAAGAGNLPRSSSSNYSLQKSLRSNDKPASIFPESTDYGMIYQFEHVESKLGKFAATEGFLFLLSTLIQVTGCPSNLGSQWRLRPGIAPYIEYVTDFILPRATGLEKCARPVRFASVSDECRLVDRALEVVEAVIIRYIPIFSDEVSNMEIKDVNERHVRIVKFAEANLGLGSIVSEVFCRPDHLGEEETTSASQDFKDSYILPQDATTLHERSENNNQMLEASFGNQVPLPKSPGFAILSNILSTNRGSLLEIIQMLIVKNSGTKGIHTFDEKIHAKSLAFSLFRETPSTLESAQESALIKAREEQNVITGKSSQDILSKLHQSIVQSLNPVLLYTYFEKGCHLGCNIIAGKSRSASSQNAMLWRERTLLLSIRILCAAAAREEAFIQSINDSGSVTLSVVPTLLFKGPIHGSNAHRFVHQEKVNVSRLSQLLTTKRARCTIHGRFLPHEILPIITEFVGYTACSLSDSQGIARCSFGIVSYISHTLPHAQCVHFLCGNDDADGIRLTTAFSKGLLSHPTSDTLKSETDTMKDAILDCILSNFAYSNSTFHNPSLSFAILGLSSESRHTCIDVILELISDTGYALDPRTSSIASKCFEVFYIVCMLGNAHGIPANVRHQQIRLMGKLRRRKFWHTQIACYLGLQGHSSHSIFREVSNSYINRGFDLQLSKRDIDVLHSIAFLLQGLAIELNCLTGQQIDRLESPTHHFLSLIDCLYSQPNPLLLTTLLGIPLGQSCNGLILEQLHRFAAPSNEVLKLCSRKLPDYVSGCAGYEIIDIDSLIYHFQNMKPPSALNDTKEWALTWNKFVRRAFACSHVTEAWTDVVRASLICSPLVTDNPELQATSFINRRTIVEILCTILTRIQSPSNFDAVILYSAQLSDEVAGIEGECALRLSLAALDLIEMVVESSGVDSPVAGFCIAEEDVARLFSLIIGAISSCSDNGLGMHTYSGPAAVLSCALTRVLVYSLELEYSIFSQFTSSTINVYVKAAANLLRLSTDSLFEDGRPANTIKARDRAIAIAARSGLSSLFEHMKSNEHIETVADLCSQIFTWDENIAAITRIVRCMNNDDIDGSYLLRQIALFHDGVQLLAKAGVTTEILKFAMEYSLSERAYLASHFGSSNVAELKPPALLDGHLSLLIALLASPLTISDRVALAVDSLQLLKIYSATFERLIQLHPTYLDLARKFTEALQLTYSVLDDSTELNVLGSTLLTADESLLTLERCVLRVVYQLSASPFPSYLLPPLPTGLLNVEKIYALQMKNVTANSGNECTWWDNVSAPVTKDDQPMQFPPTGSSSSAAQTKFASYQFDTKSQWSEQKYQYAISTCRCLDLSILFLTTWIDVSSKRESPTFCIDAVAIAKGICRCSDASRAIHDYLNTLSSDPEEEITKMFHVATVANESQTVRNPAWILKRERECLAQLGDILGRCAEKLVCLALQDARRRALMLSEAATPENKYQWAYFIGALTPTLDHTEIETKGVGLACSGGTETEGSMVMAKALRQEMSK